MKRKRRHRFARLLGIYGCISTGMIYFSIGVIAILSFLKIKHGGADESSLLAFMNEFLAGRIFVWIILLGTAAYIFWRIYETIADPYDYGKTARGLTKRTGIALSTIADIFIVVSAIQALLGTGNIQLDGQPVELRDLTRMVFDKNYGHWLIIAIGITILITAVVQLFYGLSMGYRERIKLRTLNSFWKKTTHFLAWTGFLARGIILGIIGFFFAKAGITQNAIHVVNTDKAFDFIGDHVGHIYFILTATGTIFYGLFMFIHGALFNPDKD
jgi:hypothetical protein